MAVYIQMVGETMLLPMFECVIAVVGCIYLAFYEENVEVDEKSAFHSKSFDEMGKETWDWGDK